MDRLAVTRFNDQTWKENVMYRNSRQNSGCIYNSPRRISPLIYPDTVIFVIEMNNSCLLYTSPSPRDGLLSRMPSSA